MKRGQIFWGKVKRVIDGDTIVVDSNLGIWDVRILGIDAPERGQANYDVCTKWLSDLCFEKYVQCQVSARDRYSRLVCQVYRVDGCDIGFTMLVYGMAWYYSPKKTLPGYWSAHLLAVQDKLGIFGDPRQKPPWVFRQEQEARPKKSR